VSPPRIAALLGTVLAVQCLFTGVAPCFHLYNVGGDSMADTLQRGDRILVEKLTRLLDREPKFADIVVTRYPLNRQRCTSSVLSACLATECAS
jgi:signal peptidase I